MTVLTVGRRALISAEAEDLKAELAAQAKERQGERNDMKTNFVQLFVRSSSDMSGRTDTKFVDI